MLASWTESSLGVVRSLVSLCVPTRTFGGTNLLTKSGEKTESEESSRQSGGQIAETAGIEERSRNRAENRDRRCNSLQINA